MKKISIVFTVLIIALLSMLTACGNRRMILPELMVHRRMPFLQ